MSEREAQVLSFVASGKSNRQIARELFVSPNTVANHVRSILSKTRSTNRTEAAAFAIRHALLQDERSHGVSRATQPREDRLTRRAEPDTGRQ